MKYVIPDHHQYSSSSNSSFSRPPPAKKLFELSLFGLEFPFGVGWKSPPLFKASPTKGEDRRELTIPYDFVLQCVGYTV